MIQKPRGTQDIFYSEAREMSALENILKKLLISYNYSEIRTPIFEARDLFARSVGETSDVVSKEMYEFVDRKGREFVLRPEGTAPVVRALIENKLFNSESLPFKTFYTGPMFRYERPQIGRNRQFYQFGVEAFGPNSIDQDIEILGLAYEMTKKIGLSNQICVNVNFLVIDEERNIYINDLKKYLENFDDLCDDCLKRIKINPLRVLDCKIDGQKFTDAPNMQKYLSLENQKYFQTLLSNLNDLGIKTNIDSRLVRGLDYYTGFVFELKYMTDELGSQSTLIAGGRYNNLVQELGGPSIAAAGFAMGIERILIILKNNGIILDQTPRVDLYTIPLSEKGMKINQSLIFNLRDKGFIVDTDFMRRSMKSAFKQADKVKAKWVVVLGDQEYDTQKLILKNQDNNKNIEVDLKDISSVIEKG